MQDTKFLAFEKNNGVDVINITVDTDESWSYKLDVKYPEKCCTGEELYNIIDLNRDGDICSVELTSKMLPFAGKYTMQLRAINGDKVKHSDTFDAWIKYSIEPASTYDPVPSEFYQIEQNITEINNHPPYPDISGFWMIWNSQTNKYELSDIPVPTVTASDIGAIPTPATASVGQVLAVKAVDETGKPTEWEPVTLPEQVQADWNQNDSSAVDYVKNRTHYEEIAYVDYVLNMDDTDIVGFSLPEVGETTTVKINGVESVETVKEAESSMMGGISYKYIGNIDIDSLFNGGTGWIVVDVQGGVFGLANPDTTITVETIVVHKINDKFINFDGFVRTFDYYFKVESTYKTLYNDAGDVCMLYTCSDFILPEENSQLFGFMSEIGFSAVGSISPNSCFVAGYIISSVNGSINIQNTVLGTNTSEMEELAANYGYTHTTNPKA